jgi:hypothetical protein
MAIVYYLSGDAEAKVVGATASKLLVINEAQDITPSKYDKDFAPMTAYTNATRLIVGTEWTSNTLLAREEDQAKQLQEQDGIRRLFRYTSEDVRKCNKNYGAFVDNEIKKLGRQHPLVKTQYFCERIDAQANLFNAGRRALMLGDQPAQEAPIPGRIYAFLIDVGGQDEVTIELDGMGNPGRDYTTRDIVDVDLSSLQDLLAPTYRVVNRKSWQGINHLTVFGQIKSDVNLWNPLYIVQDATGVGEGLWAMTAKAFPTKVIPLKFTAQVKSELGYGLLAVIDTGRFKDCAPSPTVDLQYANCTSEILIGPTKTMRWGVKDGSRGPDGELIHDDFIVADAMTSELDKLGWMIVSETLVVQAVDPLKEMSRIKN